MMSVTSGNLGKELIEKAFQQTKPKIQKSIQERRPKNKASHEINNENNSTKGGHEFIDRSTILPDERPTGSLCCGCSLCQDIKSK